mmetsp:Transcript_30553/g.45236  ORF Transcript_30553/g.45236 Transcript_30553/m.45236 type:complete len:81 (-) Transcript_30553:569-811(-)
MLMVDIKVWMVLLIQVYGQHMMYCWIIINTDYYKDEMAQHSFLVNGVIHINHNINGGEEEVGRMMVLVDATMIVTTSKRG